MRKLESVSVAISRSAGFDAGIEAPVGLDHPVGVLAGDGGDAVAHLLLGQRAVPDLVVAGEEARHLVLHVADQQRDVGRDRGRIRIERMAAARSSPSTTGPNG